MDKNRTDRGPDRNVAKLNCTDRELDVGARQWSCTDKDLNLTNNAIDLWIARVAYKPLYLQCLCTHLGSSDVPFCLKTPPQ